MPAISLSPVPKSTNRSLLLITPYCFTALKTGEFLTLSIMLLDSDADIQDAGKQLEVINTSATAANVIARLTANPTAMVATALAEEVLRGIANIMQQNKDDPIMFVHDSCCKV
jgi:hypothetical protein